MHIVHELDFEAEVFAAGRENIEHAAQGGSALEDCTFM
jgi:hypothetical protein